MVTRVTPPTATRPIVDDKGEQVQEFYTWCKVISDRSLIVGTGSPETAVEAPQGAEYMDDTGTASSIKYIKRDADIAGDATKGWILV
jgi:hypothetical protein